MLFPLVKNVVWLLGAVFSICLKRIMLLPACFPTKNPLQHPTFKSSCQMSCFVGYREGLLPNGSKQRSGSTTASARQASYGNSTRSYVSYERDHPLMCLHFPLISPACSSIRYNSTLISARVSNFCGRSSLPYPFTRPCPIAVAIADLAHSATSPPSE